MDHEKCIKDLKEMKETLMCCVKKELSGDISNLDSGEAGAAIDMIKDLAEAECYCEQAAYYRTVVDAMEDSDDRYGYNNRRYSNGEYAPSGRGHISGYRPMIDEEPYVNAYLDNRTRPMMRMGYSMNSRMPYMNSENTSSMDSRYGKAYDNYQNARRHYTETNSMEDKQHMDIYANEHLTNTLESMRDIYKSSDPELKRRMKADLTKLIGEMTV